jgi:cell division protein FtsB
MEAAASQPAPALVRQVNAGAKIVFGGAAFPGATELRLPPGSSALSFQFASPSYGNSAAINYQYMLQGADKDWSVWARQREANYSGLGPGHYRFRVRAQTDNGKTGPEGDYAFIIIPPWYRTTLAYALYAVLFLLLAIAGWVLIARYERQKAQRKTEALEAQSKALEATVSERTAEIRAQATEIAAQKDSIELLKMGSATLPTPAAPTTRISLPCGVSTIVSPFFLTTSRRNIPAIFRLTSTPALRLKTAALRIRQPP